MKKLIIFLFLLLPAVAWPWGVLPLGGSVVTSSESSWDIEDDFSSDSSADYPEVSNTVTVADGVMTGTAWQRTRAYHEDSLGSADQIVQVDCADYTDDDSCGIIVRYNTTNTTGYAVYLETDQVVVRHFTGTVTGTFITNDTDTYTSPATLKVDISGTAIKVYVDDVLAIDTTDSTYSAGNYGGIDIYRGSASANVTIDNYKAVAQ